jgi:HEAT repeat protein
MLEDRRATNALIAGLRDKTDYVRAKSAESLGKLKDPRAIPALIELIGSGQETVGRKGHRPILEGIDALVDIGSPALPDLRRAFSSRQEYTRAHAVTVLGRMHDKVSATAILNRLHDSSQYVRVHAVVALGRIQERRATAEIIPLLSSRDSSLQSAAIEALGWMGDPTGVEPLIRLVGKIDAWDSTLAEALGRTKDPRVVTPLLKWVRSTGYSRGWAVEALKEFKDGRIDVALIELLKDGDGFVREEAIGTLGERHAKAALPSLIDILEHHPSDNYTVGSRAAVAIGRIDHAALVKLLSSPKEDVRWSAIGGLGETGTVADAPLIIPFLNDKDLAAAVIQALGILKPPDALALVTPFLESGSRYARSAALYVVDRLQVAERTARLHANLTKAERAVR